MAKRYRYAFAKQKEAPLGKFSVVLFLVCVLLMAAAVLLSSLDFRDHGVIAGGICLFATMLSGYGFVQGLRSLSGRTYAHGFGVFGSIANGLLMIGLIGMYLAGIVLL